MRKNKNSFTFKVKVHKPVVVCKVSFCNNNFFLTGTGKARCASEDKFSEKDGKDLAVARAKRDVLYKALKTMRNRKESLQAKIDSIDDTIISICNMIDSTDNHIRNIKKHI